MNIKCDLQETNVRIDDLKTYMSTYVLNEEQFICRFYSQCKQSHQGKFYAGQLHHIGKYYELTVNNNPYRIIVVGQEYGHGPANVTFEQRHETVYTDTGLNKRFKADPQRGLKARNPHMKGTTNVLKLLFGIPLGIDHESEFIRINEGSHHFYDAFSLVNYLLCSAVSESGSRRGKSNETMHRNCRAHFRKTLEILQPTVVVVQGKKFWNDSINSCFDSISQKSENLFEAELGKNQFLVAAFSHPSTGGKDNWSRNDKTTYLLETVCPTVKQIRRIILGLSL